MIRDQIEKVRERVCHCLEASPLGDMAAELGVSVDGGKMLRAKLLLRIADVTGMPVDAQMNAAAAVELVHAASLLHDDVIDQGRLRRGKAAVWVDKGIKGAVLLGDLLVCRAVAHLSSAGDSVLVSSLAGLVEEMCAAEVEQELLLQDVSPDWDACVSIARRKTGSLFAFAAEAGAGTSEALRPLLREAGYRLGTAYQLADDVLDAFGDPVFAGKTLRSDGASGKVTAASAAASDGRDPRAFISDLCESARASLAEWPDVQRAWDEYMREDVGPVMERFVESMAEGMTL